MSTFIGMILGYGMGYALSYWLGYKNRGYLYNIGLCLLIPLLTMLSGFLISFVVHGGYQENSGNVSEAKQRDDDWERLALEVKAEAEGRLIKRNLTDTLDNNPDEMTKTHPSASKAPEDLNMIMNAHNQGHEMLNMVRQTFIFGFVGAIFGLRRKRRKLRMVPDAPLCLGP